MFSGLKIQWWITNWVHNKDKDNSNRYAKVGRRKTHEASVERLPKNGIVWVQFCILVTKTTPRKPGKCLVTCFFNTAVLGMCFHAPSRGSRLVWIYFSCYYLHTSVEKPVFAMCVLSLCLHILLIFHYLSVYKLPNTPNNTGYWWDFSLLLFQATLSQVHSAN